MAKQKLITSIINHNVRALLDLSCEEYVAMDLLHELYCEQPITPCARINNRLGISLEQCQQILATLQKKKMLYISNDFIITYIIDERWLNQFDYDHDFSEFWKIFREYGNRATALTAYKKARKRVDKETLHEAASNYIAWCDQNNQIPPYKNKAQTWLDADKRRWEDKLSGVEAEDAPAKTHHYL